MLGVVENLCLKTWLLMTTAVLIIIIILWAQIQRWKRFLKFKNLPPGPRGFPFIGYTPFFDTQNLHVHLQKEAKEYGPIFGFPVGCRYVVVLDSFTAVKECYSREDFFGRPEPLFEMGPNQHSILDISGPGWRDHRRFFMNTLRLLGIGSKDYQTAIMGQIQDVIASLKTQQGKDVQVLNEIDLAVNNSTYHLLYTKRFDMNHAMIRLQQDFAFATVSKFLVNGMKTFFPLIGFLASFTPKFKKALKILNKMDGLVKEEVKEHRQNLNPDEPLDYVDYFLLQMEKPGAQEHFNTSTLLGNIKGLLVGASDTTRLSLSWFLLLMAANPKAQSEIQEEIDFVLGRDREPSYSDRVQMPKTEAAIHESMRFKNIVHFNLFRTALVDTTLCGYDIPKDTMIMHAMTSQFRNTDNWKNPDHFDINHFLSQDRTKVQLPEHFVPFSYGKRNCPGEKVALTNIFLFATALLQRFRILPPEGGVNLDITVVFNNRPAHPYVRFQLRD